MANILNMIRLLKKVESVGEALDTSCSGASRDVYPVGDMCFWAAYLQDEPTLRANWEQARDYQKWLDDDEDDSSWEGDEIDFDCLDDDYIQDTYYEFRGQDGNDNYDRYDVRDYGIDDLRAHIINDIGQDAFDILYAGAGRAAQEAQPYAPQSPFPAAAPAPAKPARAARNWDIIDDVEPSNL